VISLFVGRISWDDFNDGIRRVERWKAAMGVIE
jgi:hypothetical protein